MPPKKTPNPNPTPLSATTRSMTRRSQLQSQPPPPRPSRRLSTWQLQRREPETADAAPAIPQTPRGRSSAEEEVVTPPATVWGDGDADSRMGPAGPQTPPGRSSEEVQTPPATVWGDGDTAPSMSPATTQSTSGGNTGRSSEDVDVVTPPATPTSKLLTPPATVGRDGEREREREGWMWVEEECGGDGAELDVLAIGIKIGVEEWGARERRRERGEEEEEEEEAEAEVLSPGVFWGGEEVLETGALGPGLRDIRHVCGDDGEARRELRAESSDSESGEEDSEGVGAGSETRDSIRGRVDEACIPPAPSGKTPPYYVSDLCNDEDCPITRQHQQGLYVVDAGRPRRWNVCWGYSDPPGEIWEAWSAVTRDEATEAQRDMVCGFAKCHFWPGVV